MSLAKIDTYIGEKEMEKILRRGNRRSIRPQQSRPRRGWDKNKHKHKHKR